MLKAVAALLEVRLHHPGIAPEWALARQCLPRIQGPHGRSIPITTAPEILRVDGVQAARHGQLAPLLCSGGTSQRTRRTLPFGYRRSSAACGTVPLLLQALYAAVDGRVQLRLLDLGTHVIHAGGGVLADVAPARLQDVRVEPPVEVATPIALLPGCLLGYALQGGWQWEPLLQVRALLPVPAASACPPLPPVPGSPGAESDARS